MSKYPDHQVQALADALANLTAVHETSIWWKNAVRALEFLGIEPEIPPTITVTVELPREDAEWLASLWDRPCHKSLHPLRDAIQEALQ